MSPAVDYLLYTVDQLCSDVESSTSEQNGAHKKTIAWVRAAQQQVRDEDKNEQSRTTT